MFTLLLLFVSAFVAWSASRQLGHLRLLGVSSNICQIRCFHLDVLLVVKRKQVGSRPYTLGSIKVLVAFPQRILFGDGLAAGSHRLHASKWLRHAVLHQELIRLSAHPEVLGVHLLTHLVVFGYRDALVNFLILLRCDCSLLGLT